MVDNAGDLAAVHACSPEVLEALAARIVASLWLLSRLTRPPAMLCAKSLAQQRDEALRAREVDHQDTSGRDAFVTRP